SISPVSTGYPATCQAPPRRFEPGLQAEVSDRANLFVRSIRAVLGLTDVVSVIQNRGPVVPERVPHRAVLFWCVALRVLLLCKFEILRTAGTAHERRGFLLIFCLMREKAHVTKTYRRRPCRLGDASDCRLCGAAERNRAI